MSIFDDLTDSEFLEKYKSSLLRQKEIEEGIKRDHERGYTMGASIGYEALARRDDLMEAYKEELIKRNLQEALDAG